MNFRFQSDVASILLVGLSGVLLYISYSLFPLAVVAFCLAVVLMLMSMLHAMTQVIGWGTRDLFVVLLITAFALVNAVGIFLPEVGFDALWYHLPITQVFLHLRADVFIPELYQSAMPRLGSFIFAVPFFVAQEFGVKLFCFVVALMAALNVCKIARLYLSRTYALLATVLFLAFHTVGWQASSAYVDLLCAVFGLQAVYVVLRKRKLSFVEMWIIGLNLGLMLSTKMSALFFLPAYISLISIRFGFKRMAQILGVAVLFVLPWYVQSYFWTGQILYPVFSLHLGITQLREMQIPSWGSWIIASLPKMVLLPVYLTAHRESFTSLIFVFAFPYLVRSWKVLRRSMLDVLLFTFVGFVGWFAIPPLSVRYALVFFALALIIAVKALEVRVEHQRHFRYVFSGVVAISLGISLFLRVGALARAIPFMTGSQTQSAYLASFADGIAKGPVERWYSGYWKNWEPPQKTHP